MTVAPVAEPTDVKPAASSPAPDVKVAESSTASNGDVKPAGSSTADTDGKKAPETMLEAVKAATASKATGTDDSSKSDGGQEQDADESKADPAKKGTAEAEGEIGELTNEELNRYTSRTRARMIHFKEKVRQRDAEIEELRPKAEVHDQIVDYINDAGMDRREVNELFAVGKLLKTDPEKAKEAIRPIFENLLRITGEILPDDLRSQVEQGLLPETTARELAQRRARESIGQVQSTKQADAEASRQAAEAQRQLGEACATAVSQWETRVSASDPDYRAKQALVQDKIELAMTRARSTGTLPKNAAEAVAMADKALKDVNAEVTRFQPRPTAINPTTGVHASPNATAAPATMLEAMKRAVGA